MTDSQVSAIKGLTHHQLNTMRKLTLSQLDLARAMPDTWFNAVRGLTNQQWELIRKLSYGQLAEARSVPKEEFSTLKNIPSLTHKYLRVPGQITNQQLDAINEGLSYPTWNAVRKLDLQELRTVQDLTNAELTAIKSAGTSWETWGQWKTLMTLSDEQFDEFFKALHDTQ